MMKFISHIKIHDPLLLYILHSTHIYNAQVALSNNNSFGSLTCDTLQSHLTKLFVELISYEI